MGCSRCKNKSLNKETIINEQKEDGVFGKDTKSNIFQKIINFIFRIFVFLLLLGIILPIIIPAVIFLIFNAIFIQYEFNLTTGIRKIVNYLSKQYNIDFTERDDYDEDENEDDLEINEDEVIIIHEKEEKDVK